MEQKCQAHNLKVVGSNPTPATNYSIKISQIFFSNVFFTTPHNFMRNHAFVINIIQFIQFKHSKLQSNMIKWERKQIE